MLYIDTKNTPEIADFFLSKRHCLTLAKKRKHCFIHSAQYMYMGHLTIFFNVSLLYTPLIPGGGMLWVKPLERGGAGLRNSWNRYWHTPDTGALMCCYKSLLVYLWNPNLLVVRSCKENYTLWHFTVRTLSKSNRLRTRKLRNNNMSSASILMCSRSKTIGFWQSSHSEISRGVVFFTWSNDH